MTTQKEKTKEQQVMINAMQAAIDCDDYIILVITNENGTKRFINKYETVEQIVSTLVSAQIAEIGVNEQANN